MTKTSNKNYILEKNTWMCFLPNTLMKISQRISNSPCQQLKLDPSVERSFCKESFDAAQPQSRRCSVEKKKKNLLQHRVKCSVCRISVHFCIGRSKTKRKQKKSKLRTSCSQMSLLGNSIQRSFGTFYWELKKVTKAATLFFWGKVVGREEWGGGWRMNWSGKVRWARSFLKLRDEYKNDVVLKVAITSPAEEISQ